MEGLINEINERIKFEKLLFSNKKYNEEEEKIIIKGAAKSLSSNIYFLDLAVLFMPKVIKIAEKYSNKEDLKEDLKIISDNVIRWNLKSESERINDSYMVDCLYGTFIGLPNSKAYFDFIQDSVMDADVIRDIFDGRYDINLFHNYPDFLLTNNFLMLEYSNFYNDNDLNNLEIIARERDKNSFMEKDEYRNFKKAANATLDLIRRQKRNEKEKTKTLKKQKY